MKRADVIRWYWFCDVRRKAFKKARFKKALERYKKQAELHGC